jgi:hypothetical protein
LVEFLSNRIWHAPAALTLGACLLLSGCSSPAEADGPYSDAAREALDRASSDFERGVLSDLNVTRAEYEEAVDRYVRCIEDAGAEVKPVDQGGYYIYAVGGDTGKYDAVADKCSTGTRALIEPLYLNMITNPDAEDFEDIVVACFERHGGIDETISGDDLERYLQASTDGDPLPFEVDPDVFDSCMSNPQN